MAVLGSGGDAVKHFAARPGYIVCLTNKVGSSVDKAQCLWVVRAILHVACRHCMEVASGGAGVCWVTTISTNVSGLFPRATAPLCRTPDVWLLTSNYDLVAHVPTDHGEPGLHVGPPAFKAVDIVRFPSVCTQKPGWTAPVRCRSACT